MKVVLALQWLASPFDRLAEGCDKVRGPVEQNLGKKTAANIFEYPGERKYLVNICREKGWIEKIVIF